MTRLDLKTLILRILLGVFRFFLITISWSGHFLGRVSSRLSRVVGRIILPFLVFFYRQIFAVKQRLFFLFSSVSSRFLFLISHRYIIHLAVVMIALGASLASFRMRAARAEDLGTKSLLYVLVTGAEEEVVSEETGELPLSPPVEYLVETVAISPLSDIDFDYLSESYVSALPGARAIIAPLAPGGRVLPARTEILKHLVREGETVANIAEQYNLSLETVLAANKLTVRSYIRPGDSLLILPQDGVLHTVKKNETVEKLANLYRAEKNEIIVWNKLGGGADLSLGETLFIPGGRLPAPSVPRISPTNIFGGPRPPGIGTVAGLFKLWPTAARRITQYFGWRHTGLDIAGPTGTPIYAAEDGMVEYSGWTRGYGLNVLVNHGNGFKTRYAHNSKNYVSKGETIKKGESIAAIGSTGRSTGPHVHFEIILAGRFKNPLEYIR